MAKAQRESGDAIEMLMEDHKRVQKLFKDFEKIEREDEEGLRDLADVAIAELQVHSMLEEELFYPAVRAQIDDDEGEDLLNEAEVEHEAVDELIAKLQELDAGDAMFRAYFTVLAEYVKHHVKEEEKELFARVRKLTDLDLEQLGRDMTVRREEMRSEMAADDEVEPAGETDSAGKAGVIAESEDELEDEEETVKSEPTRH